MSYFAVGHRLPKAFSAVLFGDRETFGLTPDPTDPSWREWETSYTDFYLSTQKRSIGRVVNDAGYSIVSWIDLTGKRILEIGPGHLAHFEHWQGRPECFHIADISQQMLEVSAERLREHQVPYEATLLARTDRGHLPFPSESYDVLISFYTFEHLHPFTVYLGEMIRVLKPGGLLVGAIPAEGGLGWGIGRLLTSRRWLRKNTTIDPDKIICWEHPTFADEILNEMDRRLRRKTVQFWPFHVPSIDLNLVLRFIFEKE